LVPPESLEPNTQAGRDSDALDSRVATLVGGNKRVLAVGHAVGSLVSILRDQGCHVIAAASDPETSEDAAGAWERLIAGDAEQTDLGAEHHRDSFDVVVAVDFVEYLIDPLPALGRIRRCLRKDGWLIASVRNVAHGSVRLALLSGSFPYSDHGPLDRAQLRFYTRETMEQLFRDAEFAIGRLERQKLSIEAPGGLDDPRAIPSDLVEALARDTEALTCRFLVTAYPLPRPELRFIQDHIVALARENDEARNRIHVLMAEREAREIALTELRQTIDEQRARLDALTARMALMSDREAELRTMLLEARDQLMRREEDLQLLNKEAEQRLATVHELEGQVREHEAQMEIAQTELARRDALVHELRVAVDERTAWAQRMIEEAERRLVVIHDLRGQLDAVRADRP
jgi:SAM-dependent methyltransferase